MLGVKVDYVIGEFIYMLPSDTNLRIGKVKSYNNKILISSPSVKTGTNLKINRKDKPDVKPKKEPDIKSNKEHKQDTQPNIKFKQDVKMVKTKPNRNKSPMRKRRSLLYWE